MSHGGQAELDAVHSMLARIAGTAQPQLLRRLVQPLCRVLDDLRRSLPVEDWRLQARMLRSNAAFQRILEDPYTKRAFDKPRGYAGDAVMLDYIYRPLFASRVSATNWAGEAIGSYTCEGPAARAVRNRRTVLAQMVDGLTGSELRIASLACGHLREAELMASIPDGRIQHFWAIDPDVLSIAECVACFPDGAVTAVKAGAQDIIRRRLPEVHDLHCFYAAGLLDYLPDRYARRLLARMFERLRPGGKLIVANFSTHTPDRGYMEALMDWWLIYRDEEALEQLTTDVPPSEVKQTRTFREPERNIVFLELERS